MPLIMAEIFNPVHSAAIFYTQQCNAECIHCLYDSSPEKNAKLGLQRVLSAIKQFSELGINSLSVAGGEPLLYLDEILEILSTAKKHGIESSLFTNCFWAGSEEKAVKVLNQLSQAGLTKLNISADNFHFKFIPKKNVLNVLKGLKKQSKIKAIVGVMVSDSYSKFDFIGQNKEFFQEDFTKISSFSFTSIKPIGRAACNAQKKDRNKSIDLLVIDKCTKSSNPIVGFDGRIYPCCSLMEKNSVFEAGNLNSDSFKEIISSYKKSPFIFFLRTKGPKFILELALKHKLKKTKSNSGKKISLCSYCCQNFLGGYPKKDLNKMLLEEFEKGNY